MDESHPYDPRAHSRFIAALIGPTALAVGLSLLMNPGLIASLAADLAASPALMITSGILALLMGLAIVKSHNVWSGWPLAVTVMGWLAVFGGVMRIVVPDFVISLAEEAGQVSGAGLAPWAACGFLIAGAFFTWQGWLAGFVASPAPKTE